MKNTQRSSNCPIIRHYIRIYDPGHSWLKVPVRDVRDSGVFNKITKCSYIKGKYQYLEEDCDLYTFHTAMIGKGYTIDITPIHVDDFHTYLANK